MLSRVRLALLAVGVIAVCVWVVFFFMAAVLPSAGGGVDSDVSWNAGGPAAAASALSLKDVEQILSRQQRQFIEELDKRLPDLATGSRPAAASAAAPTAARKTLEPGEERVAVVVFCYNRPEYLERTLTTVLHYLPPHYTLIVSQDDRDEALALMVQNNFSSRVVFWQHFPRPEVGEPGPGGLLMTHDGRVVSRGMASYHYIARHYGWALQRVFDQLHFDRAIILEEDLEIAPDFFAYMDAGYRAMQADPSIWLVSAWNDNGQAQFARDPNLVHRTNFFPGLGWLMTKQLWGELGPKWPEAYWDDWMREPAQRKGRDTLYPEVCRTYTFGAKGASSGQFFASHLSTIKLNDKPVDFAAKPALLTHVQSRDMYRKFLRAQLKDALPEMTLSDTMFALKGADEKKSRAGSVADEQQRPKLAPGPHTFRLSYSGRSQWTKIAEQLGIMEDWKANVPRTGFEGVVRIPYGEHTVFVVPTETNAEVARS